MGLIRVLLALAVVVTHSQPLFGLGFTGLVYGKNAVEMFYVISGFYMALILNQKYTGRGSYATFIKSRFFRIYPAYAVVALATCAIGLVAVALTGQFIPLFQFWEESGAGMALETKAYLLLANVILLGQDSSMFFWVPPESGSATFIGAQYKDPMCQMFMAVPQAWTIGTELWFYILAPFIVRQRRRILWVLASTMALRLAMIHHFGLDAAPWNYCFFPTEMPLFLFGVLAFKLYQHLEERRVNVAQCGLPVLLAMLFLIIAYYKIPWRLFPYATEVFHIDLIVLIFPLTLPFIFAYTKHNRIDRQIGELSYPIYLTHWIVIDVLRLTQTPWVERHLGELACLITISASILLWYVVDRPVDAWRQKMILASRRTQPEYFPSSTAPAR